MTADRPLTGVKVVELGNLIAVPYAGMLLADLGADVIKVEPTAGDLGRAFGPHVGGESAFFMATNRGKRSVALDPKHPECRALLERLVESADVVVNNLRRGALDRMGLDEEAVRAINPAVIYATVSAFGADGPSAARAGIDVVFQAESGMVSVTGHPGDPPQKTATTIGDYVAATNAALVICAALIQRERTGRGRRVDVALRDGLLAVQGGWFGLFFASGHQPERTGTASPFLAPNQIFPTADGHLALAIVSDRHFGALAVALDRPDLADRYPTNEDRMAHRTELVSDLGEVLRGRPTAEWQEVLGEAGLPVGRVMDFADVVADPQVTHNEMVVAYEHPLAGPTSMIGSPLRIDGRPARADQPPPTLGQHSRSVLEELGATAETIARLVDEGAVIIS